MENEDNMMPKHALEECCIDLASRRWQFSLKWHNMVIGQELWDVDDFSLRQGIDIVEFKRIMRTVVPSSQHYYLDDVRRICESRQPGLFK